MTCETSNIIIQKGKTWARTLRWETGPYVYKPITSVTKAAPVVIGATLHGLVDGQSVAIASVQGMKELNTKVAVKGDVPLATDWHKITFIDVNSFSLNDINALEFTTYVSATGVVIARTPVDLTGYTARMMIRATAASTGTPLVSLVSPTDIVLDNTAKTITITISATDTAAYTFTEGVYDLELVSSGGVVSQLLAGTVTVQEEVTR